MAEPRLGGGAAAGRRRGLWLAAVLLAGLGLAAAAWFGLRPSAPPVPGGDLAGANPRVHQAVEAARAGVRSAPRSADAWGRLGMVLLAHEYVAQARECFRQAEVRDPREVRWVYLRAFTYRENDPTLAADLLRRALTLDEGDATCRLLLADILLSQGRPDEAEQHYRRAAEDPRTAARADEGLARVALGRDDLARALEHARRAAAAAPGRRGPVGLLAEIALRRGDSAGAAKEQARLPDLADDSWPDPYLETVMRFNVGEAPRLELAQRLQGQGQGKDALAILQEVVADYPESASAWLSLCRARLRLGQWAAAQPAAERALAIRPDDAAAWADLGTAVAMQGQWQRATECYQRSLRLNPHDGDTHYQLAFALLRSGDRAGAERSFRESVRVRPHFAPGWRELGRLLAERGAYEEAEGCLRRAVELAPADGVARGLLDKVARRAARKRPGPTPGGAGRPDAVKSSR